MTHDCVIVADGARCRFFTVERPADPRFEGGPRLVEQTDLVNPEGELTGNELFSDVRSGRGHASSGGPACGFDDHRDRHQDEIKRRFARRIAQAAVRFAADYKAARILLVAEPRMLGMLRPALTSESADLSVEEVAQDLSWHAVSHIQDVLTRRGLLPPRQAPGLAHRPRGQPPSQ